MIDVLYFADRAVKQKLFERVTAASRLTLVTVLPPHRAVPRPQTLEPFATLERDFGGTLDQVLVVDEGKVEGMWRDPVVDLADALHAGDPKGAYAAARGYLLVRAGEAKATVKKTNDVAADLDRLEKAIERLTLRRRPQLGRPPPKPRGPPSPGPVGPAPLDPWAVLGLTPGVSHAEAKKAWRALLVQYHPDKVAHLAPEFRTLAEERTRQIMSAWEQLERELEPR